MVMRVDEGDDAGLEASMFTDIDVVQAELVVGV